jgi:formylglycine-generating enzyme required for sulfatase activity
VAPTPPAGPSEQELKAQRDKEEQARLEQLLAEKNASDERERREKERLDRERERAEKAAAQKASKPEKPEKVEKAEKKEVPPPPQKSEPQVVAAVVPAQGGEPSCPEGMRLVPAGAFRMGTPRDDPMMGFDERVPAQVEVAAFCIDQYEFPNKKGVAPAVSVSWTEAKRLCETKGKRLCSEEEWEKACKGPGNARFPYGSTFDPNACNTADESGEDRQLAPSGRFARCRSGYGVADLSGNVAEWTATPYAGNQDKTQKGGAFDRPDYAARCSARKNGAPGSKAPEVGFRCCAEYK